MKEWRERKESLLDGTGASIWSSRLGLGMEMIKSVT